MVEVTPELQARLARSSGQQIAEADLGQNVAWMGLVVFDLAPQLVDVDLEQMPLINTVWTPEAL